MFKRAICLLPLTTFLASAQEPPADEELEIRRYTVEVIVFSYAQSVSSGTEIFVPDEPPPVEEYLPEETANEEILLPEPIVEELPDEEASRPYEFVMLDEGDFSLVEVHEHLERLDAYEPIAHFGWTQPTYPLADSEPRPLSTFVAPPKGLEGDFKLYLSRYLHLAVNLQLDAPGDVDEFSVAFDESLPTYPTRYRIQEDRIFRNGDLRYFDHPRFGVLAKISRAPEENTDDLFPDAVELLGINGE